MIQDLGVWNGLKAQPPSEVLTFIADEVWRRTKASFFAAERARAEVAVCHATTLEERQQALSQLLAIHESELAESRHQAALVSYALTETAAEGYEAWCRAVMARLRLPPLGEAEADEYLAAARRAHEALRRAPEPATDEKALAPVRPAA